ncbi:hypothetical protein PUG81_04935 [Erwiniaceae bacterium L1_54_6]|nr:hypothetical protein [Erwiniaceae bacterium L1_54_6]
MDVQAYRVAVRLALDDQITRNMMQVSRDAIELNKKFVEMTKNIKAMTSATKEAATAMRSLNSALKNQFSGASRGAREYANAMRAAADQAVRAGAATRNLPALTNNYGASGALPAIAVGAVALSGTRAISNGGGGYGGGGGNGMLALPSPSGLPANWSNGWVNGVPPGGWGGGGSGGNGGSGGGGGGNGRNFGRSSHSDGMTNLATGYFGFKVMDNFVDEAAKYQTMLAKFSGYGLGDAATKEADKFAQNTKIMGASQNDMVRFFTEAQGVFREAGASTLDEQLKGARMAAPMLAKMHFAMASMDPAANHMSQAKEMDMLRFVEQAGGLNSPTKFNSIMNDAYKAVQASGGNIDFSQLRQFMSRAGTSAYNLSDTALYAKLEPVIGEMKGGAAGDALMTAYNRLTGTIKLPNQVVKQLEDMGVWDRSKIIHNSQGGIKSIIGGPGSQLKDMKLLANDPVAFYENVIRPKYASKGMSEEQIQLQNNVIFGRQGGKMFNLVEKQMHIIELAAQAYEKQLGIDEASKQTAGTYNGKKIDFAAKWEDFELVMGRDGGLLDTFTRGLSGLSSFLEKTTDMMHRNPELAKTATNIMLGVSALAAFSGGTWLLRHAFGALLGPLRLVMSPLGVITGTFGRLIGPIKVLTGAGGLPLLERSLLSLPNVITVAVGGILAATTSEIYNRIQAMREGRPYDQITSQSAEMAERARLARDNAKANGGAYVPWTPTQADFDNQRAREASYKSNGAYPPIPPVTANKAEQPVNLMITHEGRQVLVATVVSGMGKQLTKAPTSTSAFDSSMLMTYPGQVSKASTQ